MYIDSTLPIKRRNELDAMLCESLWVDLSLPHTKPITLGGVYRPPNTSVEFNDNWEQVLTSATIKDSELYILGDFNCDTLTKKGQQSKIIRTAKDNQPHQMIKKPTRVIDHSSTCIDLVFANHIDKVIDSDVTKTATSDHYIVYLTRRAQQDEMLKKLYSTKFS